MLMLLALAAAAAPPPGYTKCIAGVDNGGFVKSQMLDCATREMDRADAALNARYKIVMARLQAARRAQLRQDERRWIQQRRARCLAARDPIPSPEINRMLCLVDQTDKRTVYLESVR